MEAFILRWGYLAVGLGTALEGEAVLIAAGALAHRGLLSLPFVMFAAFAGSLVADQIWFYAGRRYGRPFIDRRPKLRERASVVLRWLERRGAWLVFGFRFLYGFRTITPVLLGANHYPARRFTFFNVLGAAAWSMSFGFAGWVFGASLAALLDRAGRVEELLLGALLLAGVLALVLRMRTRRAEAGTLESP